MSTSVLRDPLYKRFYTDISEHVVCTIARCRCCWPTEVKQADWLPVQMILYRHPCLNILN